MKLSYRGVEALLEDSASWRREIGLVRTPDHNTLCRAWHLILNGRNVDRLMNLLTRWMAIDRTLGRVLAVDSSLYDTHHRSRHYEQRCRHHSSSLAKTANLRRSRSAKRTPKLGIGVDTTSHFILCARPRTGMGSDCRDFWPLVRGARKRARIRLVLADAGYDSESNHRLARNKLGIRSLIKTGAGRPTDKPPTGHFRRMMQRLLAGSQKDKPYGQRAQVETVNSMLKRNLGDSLRARSNIARRKEHLLRVLVHNIMIVHEIKGRDRA